MSESTLNGPSCPWDNFVPFAFVTTTLLALGLFAYTYERVGAKTFILFTFKHAAGAI